MKSIHRKCLFIAVKTQAFAVDEKEERCKSIIKVAIALARFVGKQLVSEQRQRIVHRMFRCRWKEQRAVYGTKEHLRSMRDERRKVSDEMVTRAWL